MNRYVLKPLVVKECKDIPTLKTYKISHIIKNVLLRHFNVTYFFINNGSWRSVTLRRYWWYCLCWFTGLAYEYIGELSTGHNAVTVRQGLEALAKQYKVYEKTHVEVDTLVYKVGKELERRKIMYAKYSFAQPKEIMSKI